jgi:hypothetical protein
MGQTARDVISDFLTKVDPLLTSQPSSPDFVQEQGWAALVILAAFESEMSFLMSDVQAVVRVRSERAFAHLQRLIVVDEDVRAKWKKAFGKGEVACEALGSVHLLSHGIWAFKADTKGARTDLLFPEPSSEHLQLASNVDGLVLTEWKKGQGGDVGDLLTRAQIQAKCYVQGPLAANELKSYRYLIVVTEHNVVMPNDVQEGDITFRHVNIAVDPKAPSHQSRGPLP